MCALVKCGVACLLCGSVAAAARAAEGESSLYQPLREYLAGRLEEFDQIPPERKTQLHAVARYVKSRIDAGQPPRLTFICTHNSRRSQMAQIWCEISAACLAIDGVETFSGGTESTAFNPRAVASLRRAGLQIEKLDDATNPRYAVRYRERGDPAICFSKRYDESPNPTADFCAVMTCSQAEQSCPPIEGSSRRVAIAYEDPKVADDTPGEAGQYDERCRQICREMLYLFSQVRPEASQLAPRTGAARPSDR